MSTQIRVQLRWNDQAVEQAKQVAQELLYLSAENVAREAKLTVHRITGTLSRSIQTALPGADHSGDFEAAKNGRDFPALPGTIRTLAGLGAVDSVEIGSWIPYAVYEERLHPYLAPAMEAGRAGFAAAVGIASRSWRSTAW